MKFGHRLVGPLSISLQYKMYQNDEYSREDFFVITIQFHLPQLLI